MLSKWGQRFSPLSLFTAGEQGGWWDPSDFSTMFQDSAGTTPVTAAGQPVGLIRDKSGRGNHRTQGTAASRPTLQQDASGFFYLSYDGVDDFMQTASVDFSATDKLTAWVGANKQSDTAYGAIVEMSAAPTTTAGTFTVGASTTNGDASRRTWSFGLTGASAVAAGIGATLFAAPVSSVLSVGFDLSVPGAAVNKIKPRVNGAVPTTGTDATDTGTGNLTAQILYFGRRGGTVNPFAGREYQTIIRGAASTATQIAQAERFVGSRMGIVL